MITQKQFWILKHMAPGFLHEITSGLEVHWAIFILDSLKYNLIEIRTIVRCNLDSVMFNHLKWKQPKWILLIFDFSVLGARILVITAIVLSAIGAIQVWLACKCCILIDENVKPCLLLATGINFIFVQHYIFNRHWFFLNSLFFCDIYDNTSSPCYMLSRLRQVTLHYKVANWDD